MFIDLPQSPMSNGTPSQASNQNHRYLSGSQENDSNKKDEHGRTLLHHAVLNRSLRQVEEYLSRGAAVNIRDNEGNQPLHIAATKAFQDIIRALLKSGADVNEKGKGGRTPLHMTRSIKAVNLILKSYPVVSCHDDEGNTPLHLALSSSIPYGPTKSTIIQELIAAEADVNTPNNEGLTSFHSLLDHKNNYGSRYKNHLEFVQLFLENDANVHKRARSGDLPLKTFLDEDKTIYSNEFSHKLSLVKAFIERGASTNVRLRTGELLINYILDFEGVYINSMSPDPELHELLCNNADLTISGLDGNYALHCIVNLLWRTSTSSAKERVVATIKQFLDHKADPNSRNDAGETPLILLAKRTPPGRYVWSKFVVTIAKLLLDAGADPWLRDMEHNLAIYFVARYAEFEEQKEMFELLLDPYHARKSFELVARFEDERCKDRYFWLHLFDFYQNTPWISPNRLKEAAKGMPKDVADIILEMVLASIARRFLGLVKDRYEEDLRAYGKDYWSTRTNRGEFIRIFQDCRRLEINVDQSWFYVLLDIIDY
jgi:ankyrin repeat protein